MTIKPIKQQTIDASQDVSAKKQSLVQRSAPYAILPNNNLVSNVVSTPRTSTYGGMKLPSVVPTCNTKRASNNTRLAPEPISSSTIPTTGTQQVINTNDGCIVVRTDKNVYVNVNDTTIEQNYIRNTVGTSGVSCILAGSGIAVNSNTGAVTVCATPVATGVNCIIAGSGVSVNSNTGTVTICSTGSGVSPATPTVLGTVFAYTPVFSSIADSTYNVFLGHCSGNVISYPGCGYNLTAIGRNTLHSDTCGYNNTAIGADALCSNTSGYNNIAMNPNGLRSNTSGYNNMAIGTYGLECNTVGYNNIAIGTYGLECNTSGRNNIAIGTYGLMGTVTGNNNIAIGTYGLHCIKSGDSNVAIGYGSMGNGTCGSCNVALGSLSLKYNRGTANIAIGHMALCNNTTGYNNTAVGPGALASNTVGSNSVAVGTSALICSNTGCNIGIGCNSGCLITTGANNTVIGSLPGAAGLTCTLLLGAGTCERVKVDNSGLYVNGGLYTPTYIINSQTGTTYTTLLSDAGKFITLSNTSAITLTIPLNSIVTYPIGTNIDIVQLGTGQVTIAGAVGVTINGTPGLKTRAQYSGASIIKLATDTWVVIGDLAA